MPGRSNHSTSVPVLLLSAFFIGMASSPCPAQWQFQRGDVNGDGVHQLDDAIGLLEYLFLSGPLLSPCLDASDVNDDGTHSIGDAVYLLSSLFVPGSPAPPPPFPGCGADDTLDALGCAGPLATCDPIEDPIPVELAGNPLVEYPHFEFVRTFNEGSSVTIAVDPTRHPRLAGQSGDLYVVAARTAAEWAAAAGLVDVRPGGPQPVTLGLTLLDSRVTITGSDQLSGDGGTDIGIGYDVVLDLDGDGVLGGGDAIDGLSEEAGFYVVDDLTALGPLPVTLLTYTISLLVGGSSQQRVAYPTGIAALGPRPIVVISHGGGHVFSWYDYLMEHLASHGYVVMSHPNTFLASPPVSINHLDSFIERQGTIAGGAMDGLLDTDRITFIGHSLGGQTAIRAYTELFDGMVTPVHFGADSIRLVSAIGANSLLGPTVVNPEDVPFHVLYGSADGDISGSAGCDQCQPLRHYDRGRGFRHSTYIHGADHNDFNCCGFENFDGPPGTVLGRPAAQAIAKAIYLALHEIYVDDNIPARDYLWRQWESFRPRGTLAAATVVHMFTESEDTGKLVIDDFQLEASLFTSSSGGTVSFDVSNVFEGRLDDNNTSFTWTPADPMNGMTYAGVSDSSAGVVFDWSAGDQSFLEFEIVPADRDLTPYVYLSFRACQGTRHPETIAADEDLEFDVTLRDEDGTTSTINIGAYGGGIEEPYPRTGAGSGVGWQNEFETIRIRLTDYLAAGSGLDLTRIEAVRFEFGSDHGAAEGRLGFDSFEMTTD